MMGYGFDGGFGGDFIWIFVILIIFLLFIPGGFGGIFGTEKKQ